MRSVNLQLPCIQPSTSSYSLQHPYGRHGHHCRYGHGGHGGRGEHGGHGGQDRTGQDRTGQHAVCPIFGQAIFIIRKRFNLEQEYKFCKDQSLGRSACIFTNKLKLCRRYFMQLFVIFICNRQFTDQEPST